MSLATGGRLGSYEVAGTLGAGGMGEVYRARDTKLHRDVAIKILPALFAADADRAARLEREARILASVTHPNIATIYGLEEHEGRTAIVMELVDGEALDERLASRGRLSPDETIAIARQLVDALDAAHERGIVHRDLKPANIKLTAAGTVKVLDFGLAIDPGTAAGETATFVSPVTQPGLIMGTAAYMSPEQARGAGVDKRTDIWAFGCVLYELLTGRSPFAGASISDVIARVIERDPDWSALPASTPHALRRLIQRCLEKDARRRLRDIGDARVELDDAATPPAPAVVRGSRGTWVPWAIAAAAVATAAAAWGLLALQGDAAPRLSRPVRLTNSVAREFSPVISPDNKWVAYYAEAQGRADLWVKFLDSGGALNLTASADLNVPVRALTSGLSVSPDGSGIAITSQIVRGEPGIDTWVIPAPVGGVPRKLLSRMQGVQWSPDGRQIVCLRAGSALGDALFIGDSDGGNLRELVPARGGRHAHWPTWSQDQRWIYFIHTYDTWQTGQSEIYRVPAAGGEPEPVIQTSRMALYPAPTADGGLIYAANPESVDLGLWWSPARGRATRPLTVGVGEYSEIRLSKDGSKLVATVTDRLQSAIFRVPARGDVSLARLGDGFSGALDPSVDPRRDRMVFSSTLSGQRNLWIAKSDGAHPRPLTTGTSIDERPVFAPGGDQVAFVSDRGGQQGIWVISADGGAPRLLARTRVLDTITWTQDGAHLVYAAPGENLPKLKRVAVADGRVDDFPIAGGGVAPAVAPSTGMVAYLDPGSTAGPTGLRMLLKIVDSRGAPVHPELPAVPFTNGYLAWSPDGRRLAGLRAPANDVATLWLVEPGAPDSVRKIVELPVSFRPRSLTWTPDGATILLSAVEASTDIVVFDVTRQ